MLTRKKRKILTVLNVQEEVTVNLLEEILLLEVVKKDIFVLMEAQLLNKTSVQQEVNVLQEHQQPYLVMILNTKISKDKALVKFVEPVTNVLPLPELSVDQT